MAKKVNEEERRALAEERKNKTRETVNEIVGYDPYGTGANPTIFLSLAQWKRLNARQRAKNIVALVLFTLAWVYFVFVIFSKRWFGDDFVLTQILYPSPKVPGTAVPLLGTLAQWLGTVFFILFIWAVSWMLRSILAFAFRKGSNRLVTVIRLINSAIKWIGAIVTVFLVLAVWGVDVATMLASAGVVALIIGLGAQSLIADIIAGISIVFEEEFIVGDIVVIDDFRGTVREIGLTITRLSDAANNVKNIRNSQIVSVINLSKANSIAVCDISVSYSTNIDALPGIFEKELPMECKKESVFVGPATYLGVNAFEASGIAIRLIAPCEEPNKFSATRTLNAIVFRILKRNGIEIPFPQVVVHQEKK